MSTVAVMIHELNEALQGLQEQTELVQVGPEGGVVDECRDLLGVVEAPFFKGAGVDDLLEDGSHRNTKRFVV